MEFSIIYYFCTFTCILSSNHLLIPVTQIPHPISEALDFCAPNSFSDLTPFFIMGVLRTQKLPSSHAARNPSRGGNFIRNSLEKLLLVHGQHGQMKDKLRREFSLDQLVQGLLRETVYSPSLCIVKTNIYRALECVKNVLSWMFTENTWQVFAIALPINAENENQQKKNVCDVSGNQLPYREYALTYPPRLYFCPSCYHEGVAQNLPFGVLGDWGRGGATFKAFKSASQVEVMKAYSCFLGSDAPIGSFSLVHIGHQL